MEIKWVLKALPSTRSLALLGEDLEGSLMFDLANTHL